MTVIGSVKLCTTLISHSSLKYLTPIELLTDKKMKNHCLITVMVSDDEKFVSDLAAELAIENDTVSLLALGSEQEVEFLKGRFDNVLVAEELGYSFKADKLFVLSLEAVFEINGLFSKVDQVSFWTDPTVMVGAEEQNIMSAVLAYGLSDCAMPAISSRSESGNLSWQEYSGADAKVLPTLFQPKRQVAEVEPLIEKSGATRIMIDSGSNISNYFMVEAFIALQKASSKSQIWCVYDGELKPWMKPDYQIGEIPENELPMYVNSIDGVVLTGTSFVAATISNYLSLGILPLCINSESAEELDKTVDVAAVRQAFPAFGSVQLLEELSENPSELQRYNSLASEVLRKNIFFSASDLDTRLVPVNDIIGFVKSKQFRFSREEYLQLKYGDKQGSSFHKVITRNSQVLCEFNGYNAMEVAISGWSVHKTDATISQPLALFGGKSNDILLRRSNRHDVAEHFGLHVVEDIGFHGRFVVDNSSFDTNDLIYVVKGVGNQCANINTIVEGLDVSCSAEQAQNCGLELDLESEWGGCIESLSYSDLLVFDLHEIQGAFSKCDVRFKNSAGFIGNSELDVFAEVDDVLVNITNSMSDEFTLSIPFAEAEKSNVRLFVNTAEYDGDELICVVSTDDDSVSYRKAPHLKVVANNTSGSGGNVENAAVSSESQTAANDDAAAA